MARRHLTFWTGPPSERSGCPGDLAGFPAEHRLLARHAPVVTGERAAFAERPMAGNDERDRVAADGSADGPRSGGLADSLDKQNPETLAAWQKGDFVRAEMPVIDPGILAGAEPVAGASSRAN